MLAYVFWHWPRPEVATQDYQDDLITYHQTLSAHKPDGFYHTRVLLMKHASWLERNEDTYEDWHLVANSAALDPLNERAVSGPCQEPHRLIARWTQGGAGGLYHLVSGDANMPLVRFAYRFNKPAGMTYTDLYQLLDSVTHDTTTAIWTRHMNLGPGPEFCIHASEALVFPETLQSLIIPIQQLCLTLAA